MNLRRSGAILGVQMETRPYFLFGDIVTNAGCGAVVALVCTTAFGDGWPTLVAMVLGMVAGGVVSIPLAMLAVTLFGAMEVMLPVMTTGMLVGMMASSRSVAPGVAAMGGALAGLGVLFVTYLLNARLRAKGNTWTA